MKAGFCHYHKYELTLRQMRNHRCLDKGGTWCKRFEPNLEHPRWKEKLNKGKAKELIMRFVREEKQ